VNELARGLSENLLTVVSGMWYVFDFYRNIVVIIVQSPLKQYDFTIVAAGVEKESVCNPFAQQSHHVPV